ncbi:MAG: NosD domain-containing protein [Candidatus Hodarchaeota archaeon]
MADRSRGMVVLALIVGLIGAGLGVYAGFIKEPSGEDAPGYFVSTEAELNASIAAIGTGDGIITLIDDITLTGMNQIDTGGSLIIQGYSPSITVDCGSNTAFRVFHVGTCILRDFTINAAGITGSTDEIIRVDDDDVQIQNVRIIGDIDREGIGVYIAGSDVWVTDCYIYQTQSGIQTSTNAFRNHITGNTIMECNNAGAGQGIYFLGAKGIIENNYLENCWEALRIEGDENVVSNNNIFNSRQAGIMVYSYDSTYTGNRISCATVNTASNHYGIGLPGDADYNVFTGNYVMGCTNTGAGTGYGFSIDTSSALENTVVGNTFLGNDDDWEDNGTNTLDYGNNYT